MRRPLTAGLGALALACAVAAPGWTQEVGASAAAEEIRREAGPLTRFFPFREDYLALDPEERDRFRLSYRLSADRAEGLDGVAMWIEAASGRIDLVITPEGELLPPRDDALFESDPPVFINQGRGAMSLSVVFEPSLAPAASLPAEALAGALVQSNRATRRAIGVAALFTPDMKTARFIFEGPAPDADAVFADGRREPLEARGNTVDFRPGDRNMRGVVRVEFGRAPVRIVLDS